MTERIFQYTQFVGVTLENGSSIRQIAPYELSGDQAVSRIFRLSNGAKFDADGTADGAVEPGNIRAVFRITGTSHSAAQTTLLTLEALLNKRGTLVGKEYTATTWTTKTCTARCVVARPILRAGMAMATGRTYQIEIEMVWERFINWA